MNIQEAQRTTEKIFSLLREYGNESYDISENISQLNHMTQAAELAKKESNDIEVILAALLHDIGHLCKKNEAIETMGSYGIKNHEKLGAEFLRQQGFSEKVATLVEGHVQAKRYLTYKHPKYYKDLSDASKKTLEYQGGKMTVLEAVGFEQDPLFWLQIKMRFWDEAAKEENYPTPNLEAYEQMMIDHLTNQN